MLSGESSVDKAVLTYSHPLVFLRSDTVGIKRRPEHRTALAAFVVFCVLLSVKETVRRLRYRDSVRCYRHFLNSAAVRTDKCVFMSVEYYSWFFQITVSCSFLGQYDKNRFAALLIYPVHTVYILYIRDRPRYTAGYSLTKLAHPFFRDMRRAGHYIHLSAAALALLVGIKRRRADLGLSRSAARRKYYKPFLFKPSLHRLRSRKLGVVKRVAGSRTDMTVQLLKLPAYFL